MSSLFRREKPLIERKADAQKLLLKNPLKVPIVIQMSKQAQSLLGIPKSKYLVPNTMTLGSLMAMLRTRFSIKDTQALYFFVDGKLYVPGTVIADLRKHSEDGFVVIDLMLENTFGASFGALGALGA